MKDRWEVYQRLMNGFFPEQPCYCIEILEWINVEDITDEWRYIWKHAPPEPVYAVMMGGFVESLNLAFVYESIYTKSEYEQIRQDGFDCQTLSWSANPRSFHGCGNDGKGSHGDGSVSDNLKK